VSECDHDRDREYGCDHGHVNVHDRENDSCHEF
jgi:hypothetical protein